jgi:tetrahydromethanopterin S-methyltransferase subunit G
MTTNDASRRKPLWLSIEENILGLDSQDLTAANLEASIQRVAGELDNAGYNVSNHGGNLLQLRWVMSETSKVGRPLMKDVNAAIAALKLEDVADAYGATDKLINDIGKTWPKLKRSERRADVIKMVEQTRLDLLVAKAKELPGDEGIRLLIGEKVASNVITSRLEITEDKLKQVNAEIEKERAERARVAKLLEAVEGKPDEEKVKHLFDNSVSEDLIIEMAQVDQGAIAGAKKAMEAELKEKQRLAEEEAARKAAEAAGPALDDIPPEELLDHIEAIREIMEFSDQEKEIRVMCEQSAIPKALVDIAVSEPDKLDELEKKAEG